MNKEQQELLDEVYRKYADSHWTPPSNPKGKLLSDQLFSLVPMEHSKEEFINKCKTDSEFSKNWGLKIEERELSESEREIGARGYAARGEAHSRRPFIIRHIEIIFCKREHILLEGRLTREGP